MFWVLLYLAIGTAVAIWIIWGEVRSPGMSKDIGEPVLLILIGIGFVVYCVFWPAVLVPFIRERLDARRESRRGPQA